MSNKCLKSNMLKIPEELHVLDCPPLFQQHHQSSTSKPGTGDDKYYCQPPGVVPTHDILL